MPEIASDEPGDGECECGIRLKVIEVALFPSQICANVGRVHFQEQAGKPNGDGSKTDHAEPWPEAGSDEA